MQFDEQTLKACNFSKKKIEHLRKRQRGGTSGQLGYEYQRRYALLRLAELAQTNPAAVVAMEALCPVDDVVVEDSTVHEHAQCKISPKETWTRDRKKLAKEFQTQKRLFQQLGVLSYRMVLVVENAALAKRLQAKRPPSLTTTAMVVHVPHPVPQHHPWKVTRIADALDSLLPPLLRSPSMREKLYRELNHAAGAPWQRQTVQAVLAAAAGSPELPIAMPASLLPVWSVTPAEWNQASALLQQVPGLSLTTMGGVCCYQGPLESGLVARCDTERFRRFVQEVIAHAPVTMEDFYNIRPV